MHTLNACPLPRRYWKNLPETQSISSLVATARSRTGHMLATQGEGGYS